MIKSGFLLMNFHIVQFQHGLEFLSLPRCHQMGFVSLTTRFRPISNRIPEYCHFEERL